jgi:hypothetical protein
MTISGPASRGNGVTHIDVCFGAVDGIRRG